MLEVVSIGGYLLQGLGVGTLLVSLYYRTSFTNKMSTSLMFSVAGSIILLIYSLLTYQFLMIILNMVTAIMSYRGYRLWRKKQNKATVKAMGEVEYHISIKKGLKTPLSKCSDKLDW